MGGGLPAPTVALACTGLVGKAHQDREALLGKHVSWYMILVAWSRYMFIVTFNIWILQSLGVRGKALTRIPQKWAGVTTQAGKELNPPWTRKYTHSFLPGNLTDRATWWTTSTSHTESHRHRA